MKKALLCFMALSLPAFADEGMWTYNNFPSARVKQKYGFAPDAKWLEHARLSSARITGTTGCSASFVSGSGLVMTNHHCAHSCIAQLSTAQHDFVKSGFFAKALAEEVKCPEIEIDQLVDISDVTERIGKATKGIEGAKFFDALRAEKARIEKECAASSPEATRVRCDVVELYHGGLYNLYKYRRYQDVRLVFAPEFAIAFFGGDPDNFEFPRYDLDVSFLRVYDGGAPAKTEHFAWSPSGSKDGELTFVSGNPGATHRLLTMAELAEQRDVDLPETLFSVAEMRGRLAEFAARSSEAARFADPDLFRYENTFKARKGELEALFDPTLWNAKVAEEQSLRARIAKDPRLAREYGDAWDRLAKAVAVEKQIHLPVKYVAGMTTREKKAGGLVGGGSKLWEYARTIVQGTGEAMAPDVQRYEEMTDSALPELEQRLFSTAPLYPDLEILKLTFGLSKLREDLGADDPLVRKLLGKKSPAELATELVKGTRLFDVAARKALWKNPAAVAASQDPLVAYYRDVVDAEARAWRKRWQDEVESIETLDDERIARARFALEGTSSYPDATFTLRLSYGAVKGFPQRGEQVKPYTTIGGAFARATGRDPFALPQSWLDAKRKLDLSTPFNLVTDNDIIGGNSGSPMFDKDAAIVGLVFDGNIESLGGDYGFDDTVNRTVAVDSRALVEALDKVYGARRIVDELHGAAAK